MRRKYPLCVVIFLMILLCCIAVSASEMKDYTGPVNSITGAPAGVSGIDGMASSSNRVQVSEGVFYDRTERMYVYSTADTAEIRANVASGMVVNFPVQIVLGETAEVRLHKDGQLLEGWDLSHISDVGQYVLEVQGRNDQYIRKLTFTIVGEQTCLVTGYPMPLGFTVTNVQFQRLDENGEWQTAAASWDRSSVSMREEGSYHIEYRCARNDVSYTLTTIVDRTPPVLALENVVKGMADGPVSIADIEYGCGVAITYNGGRMNYMPELTKSGDYHILLVDRAGNSTRYEFTILVYFDANSLAFFGVVLLTLAGTGIYLYLQRKNIRVR